MIKLFRVIADLFSAEKEIEEKPQTASVEPPQSDGLDYDVFSTHLAEYRRSDVSRRANLIERNAFLRTHKDIVPVGRSGAAVSHATDSAMAMDSKNINAAYTLSTANMSQAIMSWYAQQGFIGYQACAIIAQNSLVNRACSIPAEDAVKNGYEIMFNDGSDISPEQVAAIRETDERFQVNKNLVEMERMNRVFGIRIMIFNIDSKDKDFYLKPFNIDAVTKNSYKGMTQIDPYWVSPELDTDATSKLYSEDFYEPTWWRIGDRRYHKSHVIITRYAEVADILKPSYIYGGMSLSQLIYERAYAAERTANEAPLLTMTKRLNVIKVNMASALANQSAFEDRLISSNQMRDNHGVMAVGKDEEVMQLDTNLSDVDSVIMTQYQLVSAIAGVPSTKLLGTSPKGFNATGEFEMNSYYDLLEKIQGDAYNKALERHYSLVIKSMQIVKKEAKFEIRWNPLKSSTAVEIATINDLKAKTDETLLRVGSIDSFESRDRVIGEIGSGYNGLESYSDEYESQVEPEIRTEPAKGGGEQL